MRKGIISLLVFILSLNTIVYAGNTRGTYTANISKTITSSAIHVEGESNKEVSVKMAVDHAWGGITNLEIAIDGTDFEPMSIGTIYHVKPGVTRCKATSTYGSNTSWYYKKSYYGKGSTITVIVPSNAVGYSRFFLDCGKNQGEAAPSSSCRHFSLMNSGSWPWNISIVSITN